MPENENYKCDFRNKGVKNTRQRTAILDILEKIQQPISAEAIFAELLENKTSVSLSTVYRTLEIMVSKNLVTKLTLSGDSKSLFELNRMIHSHYLICLGCKKIITINHCQLQNYEDCLAKETGFSIVGHKLDIFGYCPECRKYEDKSK